jgi:hypothetical protein
MKKALDGEVAAAPGIAPRTPASEGAPGAAGAEVTYTLKVLSSDAGDGLRTVLFQRISDGESIEISAQTDAENLLSKLPEFLEAALEIRRALWPAQRTVSRLPSSFFPLLTEESGRLRRLCDAEATPPATPDDEPKKRGLNKKSKGRGRFDFEESTQEAAKGLS